MKVKTLWVDDEFFDATDMGGLTVAGYGVPKARVFTPNEAVRFAREHSIFCAVLLLDDGVLVKRADGTIVKEGEDYESYPTPDDKTQHQINTGPEAPSMSFAPVTFHLCQSPRDTLGTLEGALLVIARDPDEAEAIYKETEGVLPKKVYALTPAKGDWRVIGKAVAGGIDKN